MSASSRAGPGASWGSAAGVVRPADSAADVADDDSVDVDPVAVAGDDPAGDETPWAGVPGVPGC
jgi:hypothetical protein